MNIVTEATVRIDRLADEGYILTRNTGIGRESQTCRTEGELVAALLNAIMPYSSGGECNAIQQIASVVHLSLDKLIEDEEGL